MSEKEAKRVYVMEQVLAGKITVRQAAEHLELSERQVFRLKGGMKREGVAALAHKNRGRKPKHAVPQEVRSLVVSLAAGPFQDASCQHMSELLAEFHNISLSPKTISRILAQAGIYNPHSHKAARRRRSRDRMPKEGMLVQMDASPFAWLEDRGPEMSLHGSIDDATGKVLGLYFRPEEDTLGYLHVLDQTVSNHGTPCTVYSDRHNIFFSPKKDKLSIEEELAGKKVPLTQFGRALDELGIAHIPARSPQAKGRIERLWGTLQSRLVIEMRIAGISSLEEANAFLPGFIARFNARFAVQPADPEPAFRPAPSPQDLKRIISFKHERKATNGSTISFDGHTYQLVDPKGTVVLLQPKSTVTVLIHLDGSLSALYQNKLFSLKEFHPKPSREEERTEHSALQSSSKPVRRSPVPDQSHPWRSSFKGKSHPTKSDPVESYFATKDEELQIQLQKLYAET